MAKGWWEEDAYPLVWREGNLLVMQRDADLPTERCIQCNQPMEGLPVRVPLVWQGKHLPHIPLMPVYGVAASVSKLMARQTAQIWVGLCCEHRRGRRRAMGWAVVAVLAAVGSLLAALRLMQFWYWAVPIPIFVVAMRLAGRRSEVVGVAKMDDKHIWLAGVAPEYLAVLPQRGEDGVAM